MELIRTQTFNGVFYFADGVRTNKARFERLSDPSRLCGLSTKTYRNRQGETYKTQHFSTVSTNPQR